MTDICNRDVDFYKIAKQKLMGSNFAEEIAWQHRLDFRHFTETDLLREAAWVILCSGFRESVVRQAFSFISLCFCDWQSSAVICECAEQCRATAFAGFKNPKKIDAIIQTAKLVDRHGFTQFKSNILEDPIQALQVFPFIGPITAFHLAKNLGFATAKPDRHLQRMAHAMGYTDGHHLCGALAHATGDPVQVVDIVLWRYAEQISQES